MSPLLKTLLTYLASSSGLPIHSPWLNTNDRKQYVLARPHVAWAPLCGRRPWRRDNAGGRYIPVADPEATGVTPGSTWEESSPGPTRSEAECTGAMAFGASIECRQSRPTPRRT